MAEAFSNSEEIRRAFVDYDRQVIRNNIKVGCAIGMVLMPVGVVLDYCRYPKQLWLFLGLRLLCSALIGVFWAIVVTPLGHKHPRKLGITLAMFPTVFIACMICLKDGSTSPYYAGLNLVLLVIGFVLYWTFTESLVAVTLVILTYLGACWFHDGRIEVKEELATNLYFLVLTGIIVMTGSYFHSKARFREFALRYELDKNRKALEESNQKLLELDQIKSRFFANISHELRTPLTLLLAPLETLLHRFNRSLDEETRSLLLTMHANGMRLLKLINDLLDLVRLESGRMEVKHEPLELAEFLKGLASAARQVADDKRLRLETFTDPALGTVLADRDKLEKVVLNLVFNALKFTPAGGRVDLRAEKQGEALILSIADTGMGIAEKNLPHIFDRFWQADGSSRRKYQGVGIGLALVKELVEIQGGSVSVQSQEGKGTTFTVQLPYQAAEPARTGAGTASSPQIGAGTTSSPQTGAGTASSPQTLTEENNAGTVTSEEWLANLYRRAELFPALTPVQQALRPVEATHNGTAPTVLVADDEPDILRFLKSQLASQYQVLEAVDGQQAVEKAGQFLPDLILLDMMMPEKDGLQACREIRAHTPTQSIPVVLLTARADEETKLAALSAGASDFLAKPFSTTELQVRVKNLIDAHHYQNKLSKQNVALESTIEQLKETETQLVQSEKLASLGRLSAGIIHEINNPLNFAATGLYTLRQKSAYLPDEQQEEYRETLQDVEEGIKRVKNIVLDLRMFSHPDTESRDQVDVAEVVAAALRFLSSEWKNKVQIQQQLTVRQAIWANKNKLIHVLVNLLQNSLDALQSKTFEQEQPTIRIESRLEPGKSLLIVRDNGTGIEDKHLDKIFDPFYTTKEVGEGMGLGLAICYRIVQDYDGRISVRTEPGRFCEFTLEFPTQDERKGHSPSPHPMGRGPG